VTTAGPNAEAVPEKHPGTGADANASLRDVSGLIALIGAGKMGGALLEGWLRLGLDPRKLAVIEPQPLPHLEALVGRGLRLNPNAEMLRQAHAVVIAIKPQAAHEALAPLAPHIAASALVISIMAGRTLQFLSALFPGA
jgi:pyrroline-5-carboxylate reductase